MDLIQYWMPYSKSVKWMYVEYTQLDTWLMNTWIIRYSIYHRQTTKRCMWEIYLLLWKILTNWYKLLRLRNSVIFLSLWLRLVTSFVMLPSPFESIDLNSLSRAVSSPMNSSKDSLPSKSLSISVKNFSTSSLQTLLERNCCHQYTNIICLHSIL